jgi:hypothetical protein
VQKPQPVTAVQGAVEPGVCSAKDQVDNSACGRHFVLGAAANSSGAYSAAAQHAGAALIWCPGTWGAASARGQEQQLSRATSCTCALACHGWLMHLCLCVCACVSLQNLAKDPEARRWFVQAELVHCRTAMVGAAGILLPAVSRTARGQDCDPWSAQQHKGISTVSRTVTPPAHGLHSSSKNQLGVSQHGRPSRQLGAPYCAGCAQAGRGSSCCAGVARH